MSAPEKALENAFQTLYNNLKRVVDYLDEIGRPSSGAIFRAFLWDPSLLIDSTNYKKAVVHLETAEEIIQTIKNNTLLSIALEKKLKDPAWGELWDQLISFPFSQRINLLVQNAGARDVGQQVLRLVELIGNTVLEES